MKTNNGVSRFRIWGGRAMWLSPGAALLLAASVQAGAPPAVKQPVPKPPVPTVDFRQDIRPILSANCFSCHGPDAESRKAGLRLDVRDSAIADRDGERAIAPGDPAKSSVIARIMATDTSVMPPASSGHQLTAAQKKLLTRWVKEGAVYTEHWSFRPLVKPPVPATSGTSRWGHNAIDAFVLARQRPSKLTPAEEADRPTLIRRVSLDLIGLPPTPAEVEAFVKDRSPYAYEKVVDRLLASPRFGEHWARLWLDLARYADTRGYEKDLPRQMWRYRDWVIDALNADMPYDRFTVEQLAGDLLPNPTEDQIRATAFHRNTMNNDEGGTDDEEFRIAAVKDRVDTTVQVWMGLTMGCARCHSHKYDPISHQDYYRFYALFNQTEDADRYDEAPTFLAPTPEDRKRLAALTDKITALNTAFWKSSPEITEKQRTWERSIAASASWIVPAIQNATAASGATLTPRADGAVLAAGKRTEKDTYTITLPLPASKVTALRLEALKDTSLPNGGPGRNETDQNAVVSELTVTWEGPNGETGPVPLTRARADFEQGGWPVANAIDGNQDTGWAWSPRNAQPHRAVFDLKTPLDGKQGRLIVRMTQNYANLPLGCFRISLSGQDPANLNTEERTSGEIAAIPLGKRTAEDQKRLEEAFRRQIEPFAGIARDKDAAEKEQQEIEKKVSRLPILRELPVNKQRKTRIHQRGNFLEPGEEVSPAVLSSFGTLPSGEPNNRLGAARWLVSRQNPLTPRVEVNRIWARFFGVGLVETEEDFGNQGTPPSHPELLDWLAATFRDDMGWSHKRLCRLIVTSATYRQSSRFDPAKVRMDPKNRLLARGPRFRLPAEVVRDQALAASSLLSSKIQGPSVMPPQPEGLWRTVYSGMKWETSPGEDRYRRALYTFLRRTSPYPALTTFDAGSGEICTVRRVRTNTPLQALVTLNDPAFVEAAGALARRMIAEGGPDSQERVAVGFRRVLARAPSAVETARLITLASTARETFQRDPAAATALLKSANLTPASGEDTTTLAAWTLVGNVLLNLDETLTKP